MQMPPSPASMPPQMPTSPASMPPQMYPQSVTSPAPPPPTSTTPVVTGPPPTSLFMQQKFDGSFEANDATAAAVYTNSGNLRSGAAGNARLSGLDTTTREKVYATLFVLAQLQKLWGAYESSWEMTADKAKQWIVGILMKSLGVDRNNARKLVDELIAAI